jgi:hypothetical protein
MDEEGETEYCGGRESEGIGGDVAVDDDRSASSVLVVGLGLHVWSALTHSSHSGMANWGLYSHLDVTFLRLP